MFWTFILGIIAGWVAPYAEDRLRPVVDENLPGRPASAGEMRGISLALCLLAAAILAALTGSAHALPLALGAVLGVLGPRIWEKVRGQRVPDYDS